MRVQNAAARYWSICSGIVCHFETFFVNTDLIVIMLKETKTTFALSVKGFIKGKPGDFVSFLNTHINVKQRNAFERVVLVLLIACSGVAILTTIGIVFSVLFETLVFFRSVSPVEFLFGTHWSPTGTPASFGFIPLLAGTLLITVIAMAVAVPMISRMAPESEAVSTSIGPSRDQSFWR